MAPASHRVNGVDGIEKLIVGEGEGVLALVAVKSGEKTYYIVMPSIFERTICRCCCCCWCRRCPLSCVPSACLTE